MNFFGHSCEHHEPKGAKKGDTYKCICGVEYVCVRVFPWRKWEKQK